MLQASFVFVTCLAGLGWRRAALTCRLGRLGRMQPFLAVEPVHPLVVDMDTLTLLQYMDAFAAAANPCTGKVAYPLPQGSLLIVLRLVVPRAAAEPAYFAGAPLAHLVG